jgi:3-hydroxybutyryl-CoA dehydrogenase
MDLKEIGVLGAGTAGKGIIRSLAGSGMTVIFREISSEKIAEALQEISDGLDYEISRWGITESEKRLILSRVTGTTDLRKMEGCQVIIEAVPGTIEHKQDIFEELDAFFARDTVLVSNSSALCISDIARKARHPERVAGMHFSIPVPRRPIVELVRGRHTSDETMERIRVLSKIMKKTIIEVFEMPGLITTRIMIPYVNEAMHIVMEGLATPDQVDMAIRLGFKLPIGPLAMADRMGLDTLLRNMERVFRALGELQYRPCPLLRRMVREGHLGVKTRRGFFCYDKNGKIIGVPEGAL